MSFLLTGLQNAATGRYCFIFKSGYKKNVKLQLSEFWFRGWIQCLNHCKLSGCVCLVSMALLQCALKKTLTCKWRWKLAQRKYRLFDVSTDETMQTRKRMNIISVTVKQNSRPQNAYAANKHEQYFSWRTQNAPMRQSVFFFLLKASLLA